jgi:hypothetical protein
LIKTVFFRLGFRERGVRAKQNRDPFGIHPHPGPLPHRRQLFREKQLHGEGDIRFHSDYM